MKTGIGRIAHVDNRSIRSQEETRVVRPFCTLAIGQWCSDQHGTAVYDDHLPRAVGFLHQIKICLSEIVSLADAADRKSARGFSYIASRSASGISLQSSVLTAPGHTALTRIGASSTASARVSASVAPQMLAATVQPLRGRNPAIPLVNVIEPPGRIWELPYFAAMNAPQNRSLKKPRAASSCSSPAAPDGAAPRR